MAQNVGIVSNGQSMILKKGKNTIVLKPICKNKSGFILGISVQREMDYNGFQVRIASKIDQPTKARAHFLEILV